MNWADLMNWGIIHHDIVLLLWAIRTREEMNQDEGEQNQVEQNE